MFLYPTAVHSLETSINLAALRNRTEVIIGITSLIYFSKSM